MQLIFFFSSVTCRGPAINSVNNSSLFKWFVENKSYVLCIVLSCIKCLKGECTGVFLTWEIPRCLSLQYLIQTIFSLLFFSSFPSFLCFHFSFLTWNKQKKGEKGKKIKQNSNALKRRCLGEQTFNGHRCNHSHLEFYLFMLKLENVPRIQSRLSPNSVHAITWVLIYDHGRNHIQQARIK